MPPPQPPPPPPPPPKVQLGEHFDEGHPNANPADVLPLSYSGELITARFVRNVIHRRRLISALAMNFGTDDEESTWSLRCADLAASYQLSRARRCAISSVAALGFLPPPNDVEVCEIQLATVGSQYAAVPDSTFALDDLDDLDGPLLVYSLRLKLYMPLYSDNKPLLSIGAVAPASTFIPSIGLPYNKRNLDSSAWLNLNFMTNTMTKKTISGFSHLLLWMLSFSSLATAAPGTGDSTSSMKPPTTIHTTSLKPSRHRNSEDARAEMLIFGVGTIICIVLVVGTKYSRRGWDLPAPAMGVSSVAFFVLKNDPEVNAKVAWM